MKFSLWQLLVATCCVAIITSFFVAKPLIGLLALAVIGGMLVAYGKRSSEVHFTTTGITLLGLAIAIFVFDAGQRRSWAGQGTFRFHVRLVDEHRLPLLGATVQLFHQRQSVASGISDLNGLVFVSGEVDTSGAVSGLGIVDPDDISVELASFQLHVRYSKRTYRFDMVTLVDSSTLDDWESPYDRTLDIQVVVQVPNGN